MSERKVLTKYYPPDFDPSKIVRQKKDHSASSASKLATVRLMAPFSMKCLSCGEFIYKGRKFNARKETTDTRYLDSIPIYRFYIRCTRCSGEITFKTDPKNMDYVAEKGAKRNFEAWRSDNTGEDGEGANEKLETEEEMLDRLEAEAAMAQGAGGAMADLEAKVVDARTEMAIADALDEIRVRNARIQRAEGKEGGEDAGRALEIAAEQRQLEEAEKRRRDEEEEDREAARRAFAGRDEGEGEVDGGGGDGGGGVQQQRKEDEKGEEEKTFKKVVKKKQKKDFSAALGIVKSKKPSLV